MALWECPRCGNQRSRRKGTDCNICFLLADLIDEHDQGLHADRLNVSCRACRPAQLAHLKHIGATDYTQRVLTSEMRLTAIEMIQQGNSPRARSQTPRDNVRRVQSSSHAQCEHDATRGERAKCRAKRRATA